MIFTFFVSPYTITFNSNRGISALTVVLCQSPLLTWESNVLCHYASNFVSHDADKVLSRAAIGVSIL